MSTFGTCLRVTTYGESHGKAVGCVIDGVPPNLPLDPAVDIQPQMDRRRPGQSSLSTQRSETDRVEVFSGLEGGKTLGTPISLVVYNQDQRKFDYAETSRMPRPGHAEYTYMLKYGACASSGGGRASARETAGRCAAGAVAEKWLRQEYKTETVSWVSAVGDIEIPLEIARQFEANPPTRAEVDTLGTLKLLAGGAYLSHDGAVRDPATGRNLGKLEETYSTEPEKRKVVEECIPTRCPHPPTAVQIAHRVKEVKAAGDSIGGILTTVVTSPPVGVGEPCFDKVEAELAKAMLSLPATKGFEIGEGFRGVKMLGSEHNDRYTADEAKGVRPATNHAGGTLGGITTGCHIVFRVAVKPVSSIGQEQATCTWEGQPSVLAVKGRHDPCVLPRTPPIVEAMTSLVLGDLALRQRARGLAPTGVRPGAE